MLSRPAVVLAGVARRTVAVGSTAFRASSDASAGAGRGGQRQPAATRALATVPTSFNGRAMARGNTCIAARRGLATAALPSHRVIDLPAMSPTMNVGNVGQWKKKVGDKISAGDVLVEIETDKATMDFECQEEGYLAKILIDGGSKDVPVGKPLAIFVDDKADVAAFANYSSPAQSSAPSSSAAAAPSAPSSPSSSAASGSDRSKFPPHNLIGLPAMSPTMESGNVGQWKKKEGDKVTAGDVLVEVETDKAQMDFECQDEGYLAKILIPANTKDVKVGQPLAILVDDVADVPKFASFVAAAPASAPTPPPQAPKAATAPSPASSRPAQPPAASSPRSPTDRVKASPLARKIAREKGIPLEELVGRGPHGRIVKMDVDSYTPSARPAGAAASTGKPRAPRPRPAEPFTDLPLSNIRKVIAKRLTESKSTIPHFYLTMEIEMESVLKLREILNAQAGDKYKLSVNDFVVKASALALRDVPEVNAGWNDASIRQYNTIDISIAVAIDAGLITPIVKDADSKGLATISNEVKDLAFRAKKGKLLPAEYQGGSFSISNLGMFGIDHFTAIINPPQAAILAVGGTQQKVVADEDSKNGFRATSVMNVTMSCDHRVVDGAVGARWLQSFKKNLEHPLGLVL